MLRCRSRVTDWTKVSTQTKSGMGVGTILGLCLVFALGSIVAMRPSTNGKEPSSDQYTLSVKFDPAYANNEVDITIIVDGFSLAQDWTHVSPWTRTMVAEKGAQVALRVTYPDVGKVDCFIARNGVPVDHHETRGPARVSCTA